VKIDYKILDLPELKVRADGFISEADIKKVTQSYRKDYDAIGVIPSHRPLERYWGGYYPNSDPTDYKLDFYVFTDEKTRMPRNNSNEYNFERSVEHELAGHGVSLDLGLSNRANTRGFKVGTDNTHYYFMDIDDKDGYYAEINEIWKQKASLISKLISGYQAIIDSFKKKTK